MKTAFRTLTGTTVALVALGMTLAESVASTFYVSPEGNHILPFAGWADAANNIQAAVDAAVDGDTVVVGDGAYYLTSEIVVTNNITVKSLNGPAATIVDGQRIVRCFNLMSSNPTVAGFTITNGFCRDNFGGAGVRCATADAVVTNCIITGNIAADAPSYQIYGSGGGMRGGTAYDCSIIGNTAQEYGGGLCSCIAIDCTIQGNSAYYGGGMHEGVATNCLIQGNNADIFGGGINNGIAYDCVIADNYSDLVAGGGLAFDGFDFTNASLVVAENCMISNNAAYNGGTGGGVFVSCVRIRHCTLVGNTAGDGGGFAGSPYAPIYNLPNAVLESCLVVGNHAERWGGGGYGGTLINCTVVSNTVGMSGGIGGVTAYGDDARQLKVYNSIVWYNDEGNLPGGLGFTYENCCSPGLLHEVDGNITNAPLFINPANGDFRLLATSPCIDAGSNDLVKVSTDLGGNPRILDGDYDGVETVDMGAYEFQVLMLPSGSISVPPINLKSKGRTPVIIMSTRDFDAAFINPASVRMAGAAPVFRIPGSMHRHRRATLMLLFNTADLAIDPADTEIMLIGQTYSGQFVVGTAPIKIVPGKKESRSRGQSGERSRGNALSTRSGASR